MALLDEDDFPSPWPSFRIESTLRRAKEMEEEKRVGAAAAATARLIDAINNDRMRALETAGPPNKKVKRSEAKEEEEEDEEDKAPIYPPHMKRKPIVIEQNKSLPGGVESFLCSRKNKKTKEKRDFLVRFSGERVPVTSLRGKHLVICAFLLPLPNISDDDDARVCRAMIDSYPKLCELHDFEMIMVARMRDQADFSSKEDEEAAFNRFFSAFPCLAVPFSDSRSRDFICSSLGLTRPDSFMDVLIVDDKEVVVRQSGMADPFFLWYGSRYFPFTQSRVEALSVEREGMKIRMDPIHMEFSTPKDQIDQVKASRTPLSLVDLLGCHPSDLLWKCTADWEDKKMCFVGDGNGNQLVLKRCSANSNKKVLQKCSGSRNDQHVLRPCSHTTTGRDDNDNAKVAVSVSELSCKRLVGVYLCIDGSFMAELFKVHQQCVAQGLELEVVLVFLPFFGDFTSFVHNAKLGMNALKISSWWVASYNDEISRRLWGMCDYEWSDKLLVLDGATKAGELNGRGLMNNLGVEGYPFTSYNLVEKLLSRLRSTTIESLFDVSTEGVHNIVLRDQGPPFALHVSELKGKKVLLYFDYYSNMEGGYVLKKLEGCYDRMKQVYPNSKVLFVPLKEFAKSAPKMPWLTLHHSAADSVIKKIWWYRWVEPNILAFGKDGRLCCWNAQYHLDNGAVSDSLFADDLREEVLSRVSELLSED
ncbi:unnamed protein product [Cuscuta campestris]|uniref:Thioredoxin-like fold domain-containing protein n=1 Tax=Cuscuta campestris TaxID=132261 RepID=A0A484KCV4_9ASTE|nr:unnamed protein product [Cuscuta campestris]